MGLQTANGNDSLVFVGKLAASLPDPGVDGTPYWGHLANEASSAAAVNAYFDPNTAKVYGNRRRLAAGPPPHRLACVRCNCCLLQRLCH